MMKLLLGGSPCTYWSIAQSPEKRETQPNSGLGWELFENYLIARDKYKPDYFLYENNYSMSKAIRAEITQQLGFEPVMINSALVSAQSRKRLYWVGKRNADGTYSKVDVSQPADRGILLKDILETGGQAMQEKSYCITATGYKGGPLEHTLEKHSRTQVAERIPLNETSGNKPQTIKAQYGHTSVANICCYNGTYGATGVASPVRIGTIETNTSNPEWDSKENRVYSSDAKSVTLCGNGGGAGAKTGLYAVPCAGRMVGRRIDEDGNRCDSNNNIKYQQVIEANSNRDKTNCLSTVQKDNIIIEVASGKEKKVYEVKDGFVSIKGKQYTINLQDGFYTIRKLTVNECKRLQTIPDWYDMSVVSNSQCYKQLGNGWTVDVICHIMQHMDGLLSDEIEVLSMYDGMSCGQIALTEIGNLGGGYE